VPKVPFVDVRDLGEATRVMKNAVTTTRPVTAAEALEPKFFNLNDFARCYGVGRSHTYQLIKDGYLESVTLRTRGHVRGRRLIKVDSARKFFANLPSDVHPQYSETMKRARALSSGKGRRKPST
jgi:hypothetical protein